MGTQHENTPPRKDTWNMSIHNQLFITEAFESVNNFYPLEEMKGTVSAQVTGGEGIPCSPLERNTFGSATWSSTAEELRSNPDACILTAKKFS